MINCNPETVSTDYDTSDRLYFEPLTLEHVLAVCEGDSPEGVIVQFGGQTPLKLAAGLDDAGVPILGTGIDAIDLAEDRGRFGALLDELGYKAPPYATAARARRRSSGPDVGFPLLVRPSYVLGGRAMEIVYSLDGLRDYLDASGAASRPRSSSTASSRTRSRSTSTRSATPRRGLDRRDHAARRGGRDPLRRLGLRAAAALARRGDARRRSASRRPGSRRASASSG